MSRAAWIAPAVVLLVAAPAAWAKDPKLTDHASAAGRFRVKLPAAPAIDTKELASGPGGVRSIPVTTERCKGPGDSTLAVTYADYPESFRAVPAKTVYDGVRDGLAGKDGLVMVDRDAGLGDEKAAGREFRIEAGGNVIRVRVFLVGTRLYQVMVTGRKRDRDADAEAATAFLNSFELVK